MVSVKPTLTPTGPQNGGKPQQQQQLLVRLFQSHADLAQNLAQLTSGNGDTNDIAEERSHGGEGGMTDSFHEGDQGGQFQTDQAALLDVRRLSLIHI